MFAIGFQYLTGYAVATDVSSRERAEWPPHPARVFMALAAAHFETEEPSDERTALQWLEALGPPALHASDSDARDVVTVYVPPNDFETPANPARLKPKAIGPALNVLPSLRRKRPRTFPCVRPVDDTVYLIWGDAAPDAAAKSALENLCRKVTRVGHSSSLVRMWVEGNPPPPTMAPAEWGELRVRVPCAGTLEYLEQTFNRSEIEAFFALKERIVNAKGKEKKALSGELTSRFANRAPTSLRPTISLWQAYSKAESRSNVLRAVGGSFSPELMVLRIEEGPVLGLESAWRFLTALRDTILSACDPAPEWISGHREDGSPSQQAHLALMPLAFVDATSPHADGHLMGAGLAFPKSLSARDCGRALRPLFSSGGGGAAALTVYCGAMGEWTLRPPSPWSEARTLDARTWLVASSRWATVTPIVLDRQPKAERDKDRARWDAEVAEIIAESCLRQELPRPLRIDVDKTSWFRGAPRAVGGRSSGFPLMPVKPGQSARQQVHAWLEFDQPVQGPLLLGAGRYRGYGVCRPWRNS